MKNPIDFNKLKPLHTKDSKLKLRQEKWYSDVSNGLFNIKEEVYTLMTTDNKRKLVYNEDGKFTNTAPIILETGKHIN